MAKRGRKPGSANRQYKFVTAIAATCVTCGSDKIKNVDGASPVTRDISGVLPDGRRYKAIRWQRSVCECGQHLSVQTYMLDEKENRNPILQNKQSGK